VIILGVDPGSQRTGYGVIETDGRRHRLLTHGALTVPARAELPLRLAHIHSGVAQLIAGYRPDALAVEGIFHAVNARSSLVLGHVRGVILLAGAQAGLPVHEFPPATVKVQITGYGRAEKSQVALMVARLLQLPSVAPAGDAADALAVALCHAALFRSGVPAS
jgi:crossover junction endodeoxyribonuclease RuvC